MDLVVVREDFILDLLGSLAQVVQEQKIVVDERVEDVVKEAGDVLLAFFATEPGKDFVQ